MFALTNISFLKPNSNIELNFKCWTFIRPEKVNACLRQKENGLA